MNTHATTETTPKPTTTSAPFEFFLPDGSPLGTSRDVTSGMAWLFVADLDRAAEAAFLKWTPGDLVIRDNVRGRWLLARRARITVAINPKVVAARFQFAADVHAVERAPWAA